MTDDSPPPSLEEARRRTVEALLRADEADKRIPMCDETRAHRARERCAAFHVVR